MDNLTHSLAGAVLGQLGLKKKTGLGMATLIIAANIPDIDAFATLLDGVQHLAIRRGITHGPIAMVVLPLLLTGIMIWFDRWQTKRGKRPAGRLPIHKGWLLALAYIGCLSHPALDWLNSYGVRLLEPFSSQWFYGDSIFIIDIWIWAALIAGVWISRRREKKGRDDWQRPAWVSFAAICAYIFANGLITGKAEDEATEIVKTIGLEPDLVVANPVPVFFWERELLWRGQGFYGSGNFSIGKRTRIFQKMRYDDRLAFEVFEGQNNISREVMVGIKTHILTTEMNDPKVRKIEANFTKNDKIIEKMAAQDKNLSAFLVWSRMPIADFKSDQTEIKVRIADQRFNSPLVSDRFTVEATAPLDAFSEVAQ